MRFKVAVGRATNFEGLTCSLDEVHAQGNETENAHGKVVEHFARKLTAVIAATFLIVAGAYGLITYDWSPLSNLWIVLGPIVGGLTGLSIAPGKA